MVGELLFFQVDLVVACWLLCCLTGKRLCFYTLTSHSLGKFLWVCGQEMRGLLDYITHSAVDEQAAGKPVKLSTHMHIMCQQMYLSLTATCIIVYSTESGLSLELKFVLVELPTRPLGL